MSKHECDCGARYSNLDALLACQNANHGWHTYAHLIAAAPEMYEALQGLLNLDHLQRNKHLPGVERAIAALAKAEGRS